jgi:hypothetical protein
MELAARAVARRLDPALGFRPWFLLRGRGGVPVGGEHASWDFGDMTGRYLEGLILARRMGVTAPDLSQAEARLGRSLLGLLGPDGLVRDPATGAPDHSFSQGSALYGLVAWFEDSGDPVVRVAAERLITALLQRAERRDGMLVDGTVKLPESSGSHLAGYGIYPAVRFHELTGYADALELARGLGAWVLSDPVLGSDGAITKALSWEGHVHSWLDALAGCARAARLGAFADREGTIQRCRAVYDWVRRTNATAFGWFATYPTGGSSETCAISSAIRLALELAAAGFPRYLSDVERFARNQVVEAQFRDLKAYSGGPEPPTPLLVGCFDSQSMPNGHLGTRGGEDVGNVEGCCLNGGMRALALAWCAAVTGDEAGITVHCSFDWDGPHGKVQGFQPFEGRTDVIPRHPGSVRIRAPEWAREDDLSVLVGGERAPWRLEKGYVVLDSVAGRSRVSLRYPLRELEEAITAGGARFRVRWRGDVVVGVDPPGEREPAYRGRLDAGPGPPAGLVSRPRQVPDTYEIQDAVRLASSSMLARMDLQRGGQPFFRVYPFAVPPRAEHEKWDDGDMTGRYVEALILARRMTGLPMDPREAILRSYLSGLFDEKDGLAYARASEWTPRRACLFSQSCAMMGLLAWHSETGSPAARGLLDRHVDGLMRIAADRGDHVVFPRYEYDGKGYVDDPPGKDAPVWYGGRLILPLVEYWKLSGREDVLAFINKLARYSTEVSQGIRPDGEVKGNGWWGHLHSTMDMASGIVELGRLTGRPELIAWAGRVYEWIGRTHTTRYGWVADCAGSHICESCAIASRIRLGLALHRAGAADPFGEIDRHIRNQLLENQFVDLDFLSPMAPETPRTDKVAYAGVDRMIRGTFQCWGAANDLIGHPEIEGCGAGGGVQGLALAWSSQAEWRDSPAGKELRIHLLFNRRIREPADAAVAAGTAVAAGSAVSRGAPVAAELWSCLPWDGKVVLEAHRPLARVALRIPDGSDLPGIRVGRRGLEGARETSLGAGRSPGDKASSPEMDGRYALISGVAAGERVEVTFPLQEHETVETAKGATYKVKWRGSSVVSIDPPGTKVPLYAGRRRLLDGTAAPLTRPRYP